MKEIKARRRQNPDTLRTSNGGNFMFGLTPYRAHHDVSEFNPFRDFEELERNFFQNNDLDAFKTDIREENGNYILEADLPGFKKEDIHLDLDDDSLVISAERRSENDEKDEKGNYIRRERSFGSFSRSFDVSGIRQDQIKASFENGVLKLTMPKKEAALSSARRLEIE
jgi:HSP20 family protein